MIALSRRLRTMLALGPANLARVGVYRLGLKSGLHPVLKARAELAPGLYFAAPSASRVDAAARPPEGATDYFGWKPAVFSGGRPDWFASPFGGAGRQSAKPWWQIPDFDASGGDIKVVWELSRFGWLLPFAQTARNGDAAALSTLNYWLDDWARANPPYRGPNWKCGQEASIRLMHLAAASIVLGTVDKPLPASQKLIEAHLLRIAPTVSYAIGQSNNHGTSEAAALFIGGDWLAQGNRPAQGWRERGRTLLEDRARALIAPDGTFSQYSVVYHRLMLDTYCLAEVWRRLRGLPEFSPTLRTRLAAASRWLRELVDSASGDTPNFGANDGAHILHLSDTGYRDFRPTVQLATALFEDAQAFDTDGAWNTPLAWLGVKLPPTPAAAPESRLLDDGGLALLRDGRSLVVLRYPRFRFRPGQADALHVDLCRDGESLLRDAGSYSYADAQANALFAGTASHNTVEFDGRDQMPRLGRFLFGDWLSTESIAGLATDAGAQTVTASYRDHAGARHRRRVELSGESLVVVDEVSGFRDRAVLRWRLAPGDWHMVDGVVTDGRYRLSVTATVEPFRREIVTGWESRYYLAKSELPVLEVEVTKPCRITTRFAFAA